MLYSKAVSKAWQVDAITFGVIIVQVAFALLCAYELWKVLGEGVFDILANAGEFANKLAQSLVESGRNVSGQEGHTAKEEGQAEGKIEMQENPSFRTGVSWMGALTLTDRKGGDDTF